jgi:serine phosphatase RsbU (regulator of sigma subunit)
MPVHEVALFLADLEEERLERWPADPSTAPKLVSDDHHGRAFRTGRTLRRTEGDVASVVAVVSARRDRVGVLEVTTDRHPGEHERNVIEAIAAALGYVIASADRWTDVFQVARRARPMTLAAEIQWSLLPLRTFASEDLELSGALEPAYDVGGDAFDYACGEDQVTVGIFDAMGHGLRAARLASLAIAAFRNARRGGEGLAGQARMLHRATASHFPSEGYVTGVLVEIPLATPERSTLIDAGHPTPIVLRGDPPTPLHMPTDGGLPFGVPFSNELAPAPLQLVRGDRLILYSDGVVEARPPSGEAFGLDAFVELLIASRASSPREATRRVVHDVRAHRDAELEDDATIVVIDVLGHR